MEEKEVRVPPFRVFQFRTQAAVILVNLLGVAVMLLYFYVLGPVPTGSEPLEGVNFASLAVSIVIVAITFVVGFLWGREDERRIREWYERLREGASAAEVPVKVQRAVLNAPLSTTVLSAVMWGLAGILTSIAGGSFSLLWGVAGVGGVLTVIMVYFVQDLLWRPFIPLFFPHGNLREVKAFRVPVLGRLLVVFLLIGIYPPAILTALTWRRAQDLVNAANPEVVLNNLLLLQLFVVGTGVLTSIGLAVFVTQGITGPLQRLQEAMRRVEQNELDVQVPVITSDELGYLGERFNKMIVGLRQREELRTLLDLYVSPEVAREAIEHGARLGGSQVECTVLFCDIRSFTSLSERLSPQALVRLLNQYMMALVEVVVRNDGIIDKFGGDSLLAVFGTPLNPSQEHATCAVRAALGIQQAVDSLNRSEGGGKVEPIRVGVGVATGSVVAGNVGGRERIEYTVIGETVNLAARLQDKTKEMDGDILIDARTFEQGSRSMSLEAQRLPALEIRGKQEAVEAYLIPAPEQEIE